MKTQEIGGILLLVGFVGAVSCGAWCVSIWESWKLEQFGVSLAGLIISVVIAVIGFILLLIGYTRYIPTNDEPKEEDEED